MAAYRMTVHRVTGVTPNMAMLGREVLLPASLIARPPIEAVTTTVPFVTDRDVMRDAHEQIYQATKKEARTQRYSAHRPKTSAALPRLRFCIL